MQLKRALGARVAGPVRTYVRHAPGSLGKPLLTRVLLEPSLRKDPRDFTTTTADGTRLTGTTRDMIQRYVYVFGVWEPELTAFLRSRLTEGRTFVDVGANVGYFSLLASRLVGPTGHVVAVEALPSTFELLLRNLALNPGLTVRAVNVAATRDPGTVTLYGGEAHNSGTTSTLPSPGLEQLAEVAAQPLASLLDRVELSSARVVKIDVEGAELGVVEGLLPAVSQLPDDVELVVEVSPEDGDAVRDLLRESGFHAYRLHNDYAPTTYARRPAPREVRRFTAPVDERMDLVFSRVDADVLP